jgi:hypothetical protein
MAANWPQSGPVSHDGNTGTGLSSDHRASQLHDRQDLCLSCCRGTTTPPIRATSKTIARYGRVDLLCIDELGYMELDRHGAELLFQVLTEREEKNSVAIASNEAFGKAHMFRPICARWLPKSTGSVRGRIAVNAPGLGGELRGRCDRQFRPE